MKELKINPTFKNLIRPLLHKEYIQLEENLIADGCRDPIITWKGYIIDGHNRYEICKKHNIDFSVLEMEFDSEEDAIVWICANQLGRRNISDETRKFLIGMQYESEKVAHSNKNSVGNNQYSDADDYVKSEEKKDDNSDFISIRTAKRIGDENHVSHGTVLKYASYTRALESIGAKVPELVPKILSGRYKVSHKNVVDLSKLSSEELKKVNVRLNRSNNPYFQYNQSRTAISNVMNKPTPPVKSIKDMPDFDPDAEVTELTLTIPTWISSITRTQNNANLEIISQAARIKLSDALQSLNKSIEIMLSLLEVK